MKPTVLWVLKNFKKLKMKEKVGNKEGQRKERWNK